MKNFMRGLVAAVSLAAVLASPAAADVLEAPSQVIVLAADGSGVVKVALRFDLSGLRGGRGLTIQSAVLEWEIPKLIVGGFFFSAGGMTVNRIASWDGASWSSMGSGMGGWVHALAVYSGSLFAGGNFEWAGLKSSLGVARWTDPSASVPEAPLLMTTIGAYPNPFRSKTMLVYELPVAGSYRLVVCDVQGRRVRTVADHLMRPGLWQTEWNGQDEAGERVGPGVYFIRLSGPSESRSAKVMFQP